MEDIDMVRSELVGPNSGFPININGNVLCRVDVRGRTVIVARNLDELINAKLFIEQSPNENLLLMATQSLIEFVVTLKIRKYINIIIDHHVKCIELSSLNKLSLSPIVSFSNSMKKKISPLVRIKHVEKQNHTLAMEYECDISCLMRSFNKRDSGITINDLLILMLVQNSKVPLGENDTLIISQHCSLNYVEYCIRERLILQCSVKIYGDNIFGYYLLDRMFFHGYSAEEIHKLAPLSLSRFGGRHIDHFLMRNMDIDNIDAKLEDLIYGCNPSIVKDYVEKKFAGSNIKINDHYFHYFYNLPYVATAYDGFVNDPNSTNFNKDDAVNCILKMIDSSPCYVSSFCHVMYHIDNEQIKDICSRSRYCAFIWKHMKPRPTKSSRNI